MHQWYDYQQISNAHCRRSASTKASTNYNESCPVFIVIEHKQLLN